ncbi:hypothetical protein [Actinacidiphila bryophytorum]|uniref:Uncharacterized protein n=1 Tax=Actinacidiphila bryophytorum TaxID=1436133 RepID=A0A9W4MKF6_9ACTN|nr:hypothetical protein [Actinacidiphila bryophytorum]MBM9438310.1 hypothetical protein [Actinacidiphila bryophytorum]MBN6545565.1 hypothetical protein [Actinacidiphila bryophytorum]CAG7657968.1 conserved hypothetical protein [Actinacidiphila bryophytorum]
MGGWVPGRMVDWLRGSDRPSAGISTTGQKPWLRTDSRGTCPVPEEQRTWTERWLHWCAQEFGPAAPRREIALPGFVPAGFTGTQEEAELLVRQVGAVMGADVSRIGVLLVDSPEEVQGRKHQVGEYRRVLGRAVIELDRRVAARPDSFAGLVAHELAHARLVGEGRVAGLRISHGEEERLTDLVTVYLGMGVLSANAADDYVKAAGYSVMPVGELTDRMLTGRRDEPLHRMGYLSPVEYGYALACWSTMRGETDPPWTRHLKASVRDALLRGLEYRAAPRQAGAG